MPPSSGFKSALNMETECSSYMLRSLYQTTRRHIQKTVNLYSEDRETLNSRKSYCY
jgi:hypothetical protein